MDRGWLLASMLVGGLVAFPSQGQACLAYYCSPESLAVHCPLIVIAEITSVEEGPPIDLTRWFSQDADGGKPTTATVKVLRVIKGTYREETLKVGSGPVDSCAPYPCFYTFTRGEKVLLLLPDEPHERYASLHKQGCMRSVSETELIESAWARAGMYKSVYLAQVKRDAPQVYAEAQALSEKMAKAAGTWPKQGRVKRTLARSGSEVAIADQAEKGAETQAASAPTASANKTSITGAALSTQTASAPADETYYTYHETPETEKAVEALADDLAKVKIDVIRTSLAMAWLEDAWPKDHIWTEAMARLAEKRADEIRASRQEYFRGVLYSAGVEKKYVDSYLKAANIGDWPLGFPVSTPYTFKLKLGPEDFTTDFILAYHQYDRGSMYIRYGMRFDSLKDLQAGRMTGIIPAMCGSKDWALSLVGFRAIEYAQGDEFIETILSEMMDSRPYAWRYLVDRDKERTKRRLTALADAGKIDGQFWQTLARTQGFEQPFVDAAIAELKALPGRKLSEREELWVKKSLASYLESALRKRGGATTQPSMTPEEYEEFFKEHPTDAED
jgi:hypothetical protein